MKVFLLNFSLLLFFLLNNSCGKKINEPVVDPNPYIYDWKNHVPFKTNYNTFSMPLTDKFKALPDEKGAVNLSEVSGLAYSRKNKGKIWAHNDSGHPNTLFLIDENTGEIITRYQIEGTINIDWEDMEIAVGPKDGEPYIYIADIGDNKRNRPEYIIYRFAEPVFDSSHIGNVVNLTNVEVDKIIFKYPDGSHNAETVLVDPLTKDIFIATKSGVFSTLYVIPFPQQLNKVKTIYKAGEFSFREASAGTSNLDGSKILIKNRQEIFYWERNAGETLVQMLSRTPVKAPYVGEPQGEAICFDLKNNYFTLSEELNSTTKPILYKYFFQN